MSSLNTNSLLLHKVLTATQATQSLQRDLCSSLTLHHSSLLVGKMHQFGNKSEILIGTEFWSPNLCRSGSVSS